MKKVSVCMIAIYCFFVACAKKEIVYRTPEDPVAKVEMGTVNIDQEIISGKIVSVTFTIPILVTPKRDIYLSNKTQLQQEVFYQHSLSFVLEAIPQGKKQYIDDECQGQGVIFNLVAKEGVQTKTNVYYLKKGETGKLTLEVKIETPRFKNAHYRVVLKEMKFFFDEKLNGVAYLQKLQSLEDSYATFGTFINE